MLTKRTPFYILITILLSSFLLVACKPDLQPIDIEAYSGQPTKIDLKKMVEEYPTDAPVYFYLQSEPKHGKVSGDFPQAIYTSDVDYIGQDSFKIIATYKDNKSSPVSINITVVPNLSDDRDNDRVKNNQDAFPDDPSEIYDTDSNGVGNYAQKDEDGDSVIDELDAHPFDVTKAKLEIVLEKEFNDNVNRATAVGDSLPVKVQGAISQSADIDVYRFTVTSSSEVSIRVKKQSSQFTPSLSVLDATGTPLSGTTKVLNENYVAFHASISQEGNYYFQITDAKADFDDSFTYEAELFIDNDFDYVADDLEKAIGSNIKQSDSDGDEIIDFYEIIPAVETICHLRTFYS